MKRGARQVIIINNRLYPTDDELFYRDPRTSDAYEMVDIDDIQPYRHTPIYYDTRRLSILNLSSKTTGTRKSKILRLDANKIQSYLAAVIVIGALAYYALGALF